MTLTSVLLVIAALAIWLPWLWRYQLRPYFAKKNIYKALESYPQGERLSQAAKLLDTLYRGVPSKILSQWERARLQLKDDAFIYGEIDFLSFILLLEKVKPQAGEIFYDLGSGSGKAVFAAGLCYDLSKACGIEFLAGLCKLAKAQIHKAKTLIYLNDEKQRELYLPRLSSIQFLNANFLHCDFADGDIVFINATCLSYPTWEALGEKLQALKSGSRIITTSKKIQLPQFELYDQATEVMSWGMNSVYIYKKL